MLFHNELVKKGDLVFDINRGNGVVSTVTETFFEVTFDMVRIYYDSKGVQKGKTLQSLFWSKPYVIAPKKDGDLTTENINQFNAVLDLLKTFSK